MQSEISDNLRNLFRVESEKGGRKIVREKSEIEREKRRKERERKREGKRERE